MTRTALEIPVPSGSTLGRVVVHVWSSLDINEAILGGLDVAVVDRSIVRVDRVIDLTGRAIAWVD